MPDYYYQAFLRFYFIDWPEVQLKLQVISLVQECIFQSAQFIDGPISQTYLLGHSEVTIDLPRIMTTPKCGFPLILNRFSIEPQTLPSEFESYQEAIDVDLVAQAFVVRKSEELGLLGQTASFLVTFVSLDGIHLPQILAIEYASGGVWFANKSEASVPPITCSAEDRNW